MTRVASFVGVAAVATMILLSGCPTAVKVDLAKQLAGTWTTAELPGAIPHPELGEVNATMTAKAVIMDGPGHHEGTFTLTVTSVPTDAMVKAALPQVVTTATGTINVQNSTEMRVIVESIANVPAIIPVPPDITSSLQNIPLDATYQLADNQLTLTSAALVFLGVVQQGESLTLTR